MSALNHDYYYGSAMEEADRELFAGARRLSGLDEEIAVLRVNIFRLLEGGAADPRELHSAVRLLVQAVAAQHRLSGEQAERLSEATGRVIEEFIALFAAAGEETGT